MIREALELIQETALDAKAAGVAPGVELRNATLLETAEGLVKQPHDPPARQHKVRNLDTLSTLVEGRADASVWHADNTVIAILADKDDGHRDDRVTWSLSASAKFQCLTRDAATARSHADFVKFLVQNLRDEFDAAAPGLLGTIRSLKFLTADQQTGNIQQGRESVGRSIDAEVTGAKDLPETVLIKVRRWASLEYLASVECLLVLDTTNRTLALKPLADQLECAENDAQDWLDGQLTDAVKCPVYYGTP